MHIVMMRSSTGAATQSSRAHPTTSWDIQQRVNGRERRDKEKRSKDMVSQWFQEHRVRVVKTEKYGSIVDVSVLCPRDYIRDRMLTMPALQIPISTDKATWRPRVSELCWQPPYEPLLRVLHIALKIPMSRALRPAADNQGHKGNREEQVKFSGCLERAMGHIYFGAALRERGMLQVPEVHRSTHAAGKRRRGAREFAVRVADDKQKVSRALDLAATVPHGPPGLYHAAGRAAVVDSYIMARLAAPSRNSVAEHGPTLLAAAIFALMPHIVPCAPDAKTATVLATKAHQKFAETSSGWLGDISKNAERAACAMK